MAGFGFGAVYYGVCAIAAIYEVTALVHMGMFAFLSGTSINELAFALCAGAVGNNKAALVHTVLAVLSIGGAMYELSLSGIIGVTGPKGTVEVDIRGKANKGSSAASRPTWRQSELDAATNFPDYDAQKSFINGEEVPYGTKGSVRPDYYKDGFSVDIKNYNVESASGRSNLVRNIEKQYYQRIENLPEGTIQSVMIDIRGQNFSDAALNALYDDIMYRTNNGIGILFKMD